MPIASRRSTAPRSTTPWRTPWPFPGPSAPPFARWPRIETEALRVVREPLQWRLDPGVRVDPPQVSSTIRRALLGPADERWTPPSWLMPHQASAARQLAARLALFNGALLADAPGLGKTYVGLALATRYRRPLALIPASLISQWRRVARSVGIELAMVSHEAVSRGAHIPAADLLVVDEAHRFRNPATRRYDRLARRAPASHLLLLTATPVVNRPADAVHLLRLFLPDHGLAAFGVPSIERALAARAHGGLAHAFAALMVARTAEAAAAVSRAIPAVSDVAELAAPPVTPARLEQLSADIDELEFPSFESREAAALLRLHLFARLASSVPALVSTLHRHRRYLDHAIASARRGEPVSRHAAWLVLGPDEESQLDLPGLLTVAVASPLDASRLEAERRRIAAILDSLPPDSPDPKADALRALLADNGGKSIVFTSAVATARHLARRLGWRRLAIATGRGARIATGPVSLDEVLALFAPEARGARAPAAALHVDTLIATDLVSEGLNLQDADRVIHFDLPWSPLRLAQRVGRVARLGSRHASVRVAWFRPPAVLERRLALTRRIAVKVREQLELGVAVSSRVGRAHVTGGLFDWRERLTAGCEAPATPTPHHAVVRAPPCAAFAVRWSFGPSVVPTVIVTEGEPAAVVVRDERRAAVLLEQLLAGPPSEAPGPARSTKLLQGELRARIAALESGPVDDATRRLAKRIVRRARLAGRARNHVMIALLDLALDRLTAGLAAGSARALADRLGRSGLAAALREWLSQLPPVPRRCPEVVLDAALFADGSVAP